MRPRKAAPRPAFRWPFSTAPSSPDERSEIRERPASLNTGPGFRYARPGCACWPNSSRSTSLARNTRHNERRRSCLANRGCPSFAPPRLLLATVSEKGLSHDVRLDRFRQGWVRNASFKAAVRQPEVVQEVVVKRIIMAARRGERDLARLREVALTGQESRENRWG
jgi:hypothetical protein